MAIDFCDYFWGEEHGGWNVLYQNMKQGQSAGKEIAEFFKERWSIDEAYSKSLAKLANKASLSTDKGTFTPIFQLLKSSSERLSIIHANTVQKLQDLLREVSKYNEELHRKQKLLKDEESVTEEVVKSIQTTGTLVQKAKENYSQKMQDLEKIRKESNASAKDMEKIEMKMRKSQEEYKSLIEKYNTIRDDFEGKMIISCRRFQNFEESHLSQMLHFVHAYIQLLQKSHKTAGKVHQDFLHESSLFTIEKLLDTFVLSKLTGLEKPSYVTFEDAASMGSGISGQQSPELADQSKSSIEETSSTGGTSINTGMLAGGFLRSRRERKKDKKNKKRKDGDSLSNKEERSDNEGSEEPSIITNSEPVIGSLLERPSTESMEENADGKPGGGTAAVSVDAPQVDEEGFSIIPHNVQKQLGSSHTASFDSTSDSESESEGTRKIHVEIKPISNGAAPASASVDELRATIVGMSLSPQSTFSGKKQFSDDNMDTSGVKPGGNLHNLSEPSLNKDTTVSPRNSPVSLSQSVVSPVMAIPPRADRYAELSELLNEVCADSSASAPPLLPKASLSRGSTPVPTALPRPPSRKGLECSRGRQSPATFSTLPRTDSNTSVEFRSLTGLSRGPSPLTIGMSDMIPVAVAFQELCHTYFRGSDEQRCQIKVTGEMMVSFPSGIVGVLTSNPSPAQLSFSILNFSKVKNILPNKQLIVFDEASSSEDKGVYSFIMPSLTNLLRRQAEQNPSASYFNVDMVKYQVSDLQGAQSSPLQLVSYWKTDEDHTDLRIDYKYNPTAMAAPLPLVNVAVSVPVDGLVVNMQSKPSGQWLCDKQLATWKLNDLSQNSSSSGVGTLRAKFDVAAGPSTPATVSVQFTCEGTTMSGLDFLLLGNGYRVSLVKKRFVSGKYICDADAVLKLKYGTIPR